jgi:hypothetical protein
MDAAIAYEANYLRAGLEQLKDYLLSKQLFWNSGLGSAENGRPYPQLTLGNLLFSKRVVETAGAEPELINRFDAIKKEWKSAWQSKAEREFASRLDPWREYIVYLKQYASADSRDYETEIRVRTLLELLIPEAPGLSENQLHTLEIEDQHLRRLLDEGDFVWDAELKPAFPHSRFWYLYGKPNPKKNN